MAMKYLYMYRVAEPNTEGERPVTSPTNERLRISYLMKALPENLMKITAKNAIQAAISHSFIQLRRFRPPVRIEENV